MSVPQMPMRCVLTTASPGAGFDSSGRSITVIFFGSVNSMACMGIRIFGGDRNSLQRSAIGAFQSRSAGVSPV